MKKLTTKELADSIVELTKSFNERYKEEIGGDLDKRLWGALHTGYVSALKQFGYSLKELCEALDEAQKIISKWK